MIQIPLRRYGDIVNRQRSPNYPGIDLQTAIESVCELYTKNLGRGQFNPDEAAKAWGYRGPSGPVRVRIAALRQYGLLDGQRGENPKLSRRGLTFVLRNQASREYRDALQEAALAPPLFREIRDSKPDASNGVIRHYLIVDRNFTDDGAKRLIDVYRATMRLAGLDGDGIMSGLEEEEIWPESEDTSMVSARTSTEQEAPPLSVENTRVPLRLMGGSFTVTVELPASMTERAWQQMVDMLHALKPGYVPEDDNEPVDRPAPDHL